MTAQFQPALEYTLVNEGGYVDNPNDSGAATNFGITIATLSSWRKSPCTVSDVQNLTIEEAGQIYEADYWNRLLLGQLSSQGIATAIFDMAVNCGLTSATKFAQKAAQANMDGVMGPNTIAAINNVTDTKAFMSMFVTSAIQHYEAIVANHPEDAEFLPNWLKRANKLLTLEV